MKLTVGACIRGFEITSSLSPYNDDDNDGNDHKQLVTGGSKTSTREKVRRVFKRKLKKGKELVHNKSDSLDELILFSGCRV